MSLILYLWKHIVNLQKKKKTTTINKQSNIRKTRHLAYFKKSILLEKHRGRIKMHDVTDMMKLLPM